ncbi:MAG: D-aminoacyl-tRNA deacylase [Clostridiaceae bacterium]|nr:D-tyrosyl-tRNA(Tyr) deacylase [Eubacteriales bacterium]
MRAVIQRVSSASVAVEGRVTGSVEKGYLVLLGIEEDDTEADLAYICEKLVGLRIFEDDAGKMNLSIADVNGAILLVSQFTLLGDARHGRRPSFIRAARPEHAVPLYEAAVKKLRESVRVETGEFGAHMDVALVNDGPVTILLESKRAF